MPETKSLYTNDERYTNDARNLDVEVKIVLDHTLLRYRTMGYRTREIAQVAEGAINEWMLDEVLYRQST